ncbi:MAG: S41 family peptidase [Bacteroidota bacterium]
MRKITLALLCVCFAFQCAISQEESRLSTQDKLYGLAQFWHGAKINFAFFDQVPDLNWDSLYYDHISKVQETKTDYEYIRMMQRLCHGLHDGHTRVYMPNYLRQKRNKPAVYTDIVGEQVFITRVINDTIWEMGIRPNMEILEIDGQDVHKYAAERVTPYTFSSTRQDELVQTYMYQLLEGWVDEPVKLKLKSADGTIMEKELPRDLIRNHLPDNGIMSFQMLESNLGLLTISRFWGDDFQQVFDSIYPMLDQTNGLIVDLRENLGGNSGNSVYVMQHLSHKPFYTSNWSTPVYNAAYDSWNLDQEWYGEDGELVEPDEEIATYQKPIILLIGRQTYSAAEDFCSYYQQADIGPMMGSLTAGSTGNPTGVNLVKNIWAQICTKRDVFYDGTEFVGYGVKPDIPVDQAVDDFLQDEDTVLEAAVEYLEGKM